MNIEILMSTYNGMNNIERQIETVLRQENVDIHLTIRDDGSNDKTVEIIKNLQRLYPDQITLYCGKNIGYRKSFLQLLNLAAEADYYGFSDQDDIWKPNKIQRAIECLEQLRTPIKLYASSLEIVDSQLNVIGYNDISKMPNTIASYFTRSRLAGCTFVFSRECKKLAQKFADTDLPADRMPDHDFVVGSCAFACGSVYLDSERLIYHVRYPNSVTSGGNGLRKRIKTEWNIVFRRKEIRLTMARELINNCGLLLNHEARIFLSEVANYKNKWNNRLRLLLNTNMKTGILLCDLEQKVKILVGTY